MLRLSQGIFFGHALGVRSFGPYTVTATRYRPGQHLPRHCHERPYLYVPLAGCMRERSLRREHECSRGWVVLNRAGESHDDCVLSCGAEGLNIEFDNSALDPAESGSADPVAYFHAGSAITAVGRLELAMLASPEDPVARLAAEESVINLTGALARRQGRGRRHTPAWLGLVEDALRTHHTRRPDLHQIARAAGVNASHLCRVFAAVHGCSMSQYAARLRADGALRAVIDSQSPLAALAARHGFSDQAHLTRTLRARFGVTPGQVRRTRQASDAA